MGGRQSYPRMLEAIACSPPHCGARLPSAPSASLPFGRGPRRRSFARIPQTCAPLEKARRLTVPRSGSSMRSPQGTIRGVGGAARPRGWVEGCPGFGIEDLNASSSTRMTDELRSERGTARTRARRTPTSGQVGTLGVFTPTRTFCESSSTPTASQGHTEPDPTTARATYLESPH